MNIGDKVRVVSLYTGSELYVDALAHYLDKTGLVKQIDKHDNTVFVQMSGQLDEMYWFEEDWLQVVEEAKPKYWTGQIVITDEGFSHVFTTGKVYEVKDGVLYNNTGTLYVPYKFDSIDSIQEFLDDATFGIKIIEFKGFANKEDE